MDPIRLKHQSKVSDIVDLGTCIKIENSNKIFQIIGINSKNSICWIREWPLNYESYQKFEISINKVKLSTICPTVRKKA